MNIVELFSYCGGWYLSDFLSVALRLKPIVSY